MKKIIKDAEVAFASLTNDGGFKNGKHLLAVFVDKKFKKDFMKTFETLWNDEKSSKAKKPAYDPETWFSEEEGTERIMFWLNAKANTERGISFKNGTGCSFTLEDFGKIGKGSIIDISYDIYYFKSGEYGEMVLRSIKAVALKKLVEYSGDGDDLDGDALHSNGQLPTNDEEPKKDKKKKKKKSKEA